MRYISKNKIMYSRYLFICLSLFFVYLVGYDHGKVCSKVEFLDYLEAQREQEPVIQKYSSYSPQRCLVDLTICLNKVPLRSFDLEEKKKEQKTQMINL